MTDGTDTHNERRHFFAAAKVVASITLCSRIGGLVRDMILSRTLGASAVTSAFWTAFSIPNFFRRLFGEGALSAAFVPVFSEITEREGADKAAALFANIIAVLSVTLCGLFLLVELGLLVAWWLAPADAGGHVLTYTAIMMPFMITICLVALGSAALNCRGHFVYPAAAPIIMNVVLILFAALLTPLAESLHAKLTILAIGMPITGVLQLAALIWVLRAHKLPIAPRLRPMQPGLRKVITSMAPMMIPLGVLQINALLDKVIALTFSGDPGSTITLVGWTLKKPLEAGAVTWMNFGERLFQFPMGVLAISLATAMFPLFSRYAARGDDANLKLSVNRAMRLAVFEGLPSGVGLMMLGVPLVGLIFGGGRFSAHDVSEAAHVVWFYGIGMWAFCSHHILLRAFYATGDRRTPLRVACSIVGLNFVLSLGFIWLPDVRHGAFGLASSITQMINVTILAAVLRRRMGRGFTEGMALSVLRVAIATAAMAGALWAARVWPPRWGLAGDLYVTVAGVVGGMAVYFATCWLLRAPEIGELLELRHRKKQTDESEP